MQITIVIDSLVGGGAQRAAILLAEGLIKRNYQVSFVTIYGKESDFYQLPPKVERIALNIAGQSPNLINAIGNNIARAGTLRKAIDNTQPDVVISYLEKTSILTLIACWGAKYPIIVSEQNDPTRNTIGLAWNILRRLVYPKAAKIISCSQGVDDKWHWLSPEKRAVIYNPLAVTSQNEATEMVLPPPLDTKKKTVVAMGRLTEQKGFDYLLDAFAMTCNLGSIEGIGDRFTDWQLLILGEGELRAELESQKDNLGLQNAVAMPGIINNPFPLLQQCDLFVLSSRYEGFGNVIIEAMACDLPVISTDCPSGPGEIITNEVNGILVTNQDPSSLAKAMSRLMGDRELREQLSANAKSSLHRFQLDAIVSQWEKLIESL